MHFLRQLIQRGVATTMLVVMFAMSFMVMPQAANAQLVVANPDLLADSIQKQLNEKIEAGVKSAFVSSMLSQMVNMMQLTVNQMANATAVFVASGGPGGTPLFTRATAGDYGLYVGAQTAAMAVDALDTDNLTGGVLTGVQLQVPDDPAYFAALRAGIRENYVRPEVSFNFSDIANNYGGFLITVGQSGATRDEQNAVVLSSLAQSFRSNEITNGLQIYAGTIIQSQYEQQLATQQTIQNNGFRDQRSAISGQVNLPASMVEGQLADAVRRVQETPIQIAQNSLGNADVGIQFLAYAGSVFANALAPVLLQKLYTGLFADIPDLVTDPFNPNAAEGFGRDRARSVFSNLLAFKPVQSTDFSLISQLSSCPASTLRNSRQLFSCAIDSSFAAAVARAQSTSAMTLSEAIEEGYINGGWALIPSSDTARNQDPRCYTYGFCEANLVKLRKARIIPVGWELAADSTANSAANPITLKEVMNSFQDCNALGELDDAHPWCKLIDPNWVLKAPQTQCNILAPGQLLAAAGTSARSDECVDVQTCIAEDENGNCLGGYGYCVREQNTWEFRGDSCPAEYASCLSFTDSSGDAVDYLVNTVDYGECDADDVGCLWRATQKRQQPDGTYDWPQVSSLALADTDTEAFRNRIYFNSSVEDCAASEAGCSELVIRTNNLSLNMVQNPSFEADTDEDGRPDGWLSVGPMSEDRVSRDNPRSGGAALSAQGDTVYQFVRLNQARLYTFSYYAYAPAGANFPSAQLSFTEELTGAPVSLAGLTVTGNCGVGPSPSSVSVSTQVDAAYSRLTCTFSTPELTNNGGVDVRIAFNQSSVVIDDIQLEQGGASSSYALAYSGQTAVEYAKVAPDYLGCTGGPDDPSECANFARACAPGDAGCQAYSPTNGGPTVTGIISSGDLCPAVCAGYDTYKQEPTYYEPTGIFPMHFIPATAETCNESAVGCTEFTNLETQDREYFTYLRACAERNETTQESVFYTWEGTDVDGFQLKTWNLLKSNTSAAPCTDWRTSPDGVVCVEATASQGTDACNEYLDIFTNPDCREFYDTAGAIHYREWSATVTVAEACTPYRMTQIDSPDINASGSTVDEQRNNCQTSGGYYDDANGDCQFFGLAEQSLECGANQNGCRAYTGGRSGNARFLLEETFEPLTLANFEGEAAIEISLESLAANGHSLESTGDVYTNQYDNGGVCQNEAGCASPANAQGEICTVRFGERYCGTLAGELFAGKSYTLEFWAKGAGSLRAGLGFEGASMDLPFDESITLAPDWRRYTVGPVIVPAGFDAEAGRLMFEKSGSGTYYLDNIYLREGEDQLTLIAGSWNTPAQCDVGPSNQYIPQYHLGCTEYNTANNITAYIRQFSRLCSDDAVGCTGYYDTQESNATGVEVRAATCSTLSGGLATELTDCYFEATGGAYDTTSPKLCQILPGESGCTFDSRTYLPDSARSGDANVSHIDYGPGTRVVPADTDRFLIIDRASRCAATGAGCTEVGEFELSPDQSAITEWSSNYLVNDPDRYDAILCSEDQLFCDAFETADNGTYYFKNPLGKTCEYRTDVKVGASVFDGWFVEGTTNFCYGEGTCSDGSGGSNGFGACSLDSDCRVNTGTCSDNGALCTTDFDCNPSASCQGTSEAVCTITQGSYVIGGEVSGIWRNGDAAYDGWAGVCPAQFNGCSEFQDPLDFDDSEFYGQVQGKAYNFINNDALDENNLISSQQCKGLVSQEQGCVLFDDTSTSRQMYSASATYMASSHADVLSGGARFDLVKPIDCSLPSEQTTVGGVDLCSQRCVYKNALLDSTLQDYGPSAADVYTFGGSCVTADDCAMYESNIGTNVKGECLSEVTYRTQPRSTGTNPTQTENVPRLENDSNRVLKVERDRMCSEWLTCSGSRTVWDSATSSFRTVCDEIDLCKGYSGTGDSSFCSAWDSEDPATVLDVSRYSSRDISWYGEEYSGYAIPNLFPVQHLEQVNIAPEPGTCYFPNDAANPANGFACGPNNSCGGVENSPNCVPSDQEPEFRLGFVAGSCQVGASTGEACTVGYCEETGAACTTTADCPASAGACVTGDCFVIDAGSACTQDSDCAGESQCLAGTCALDTGLSCDTGYACTTAGATCIVAGATKTGSCFNDSCVLTVDGKQFNEEIASAQLCRAYPEANAPFPNSVVDSWTTIERNNGTNRLVTRTLQAIGSALFGMEGPERGGVLPRTTKSGFENVKLCAAGEECECSYTKIATSSGQAAYVSSGTKLEETEVNGICQGGDLAGALCNHNSDCSLGGTGSVAGTCVPITREDTIIGMPGYCLEYDTSINVLGDQTKQACLTWLPVDQLAGSTDLNAKFREAGYEGGETNYCAELGVYANLNASDATAGPDNAEWTESNSQIACLDQAGTGTNYQKCVVNNTNFVCPAGYYAVVGDGHPGGSTPKDNFANLCKVSDGENDCPFVCVPNAAVVIENGETTEASCFAQFVQPFVQTPQLSRSKTVGDYTWTTEIYWEDNLDEFNRIATGVQACRADGIEIITTLSESVYSQLGLSRQGGALQGGNNTGWRDYEHANSTAGNQPLYLACKDIVEVDSGDYSQSAAYTDRIYNEQLSYTLTAVNPSKQAAFGYNSLTGTQYFGRSENPLQILDDVDTKPSAVAACFGGDSNGDGVSTEITPPGDRFGCLLPGSQPAQGLSLTNPPARSFVDFFLQYKLSSTSPTVIEKLVLNTGAVFGNTSGTANNNLGTYEASDACQDGVESNGYTIRCQDGTLSYSTASAGDIVAGLKQIFAKSLTRHQFRDGVLSGTTIRPRTTTNDNRGTLVDLYPTGGGWGSDVYQWDERAQVGTPPRLYSVDINSCKGTACEEGSLNRITINEKDFGEQRGSAGFFRSNMRFFMAADKNQLPIRRVIVDWGDGDQIGNDAPDNFYKNHRGLVEGSESQSKCDTGAEWGMTSDSCDENYMNYTHTYTCSARDLATLPVCGPGGSAASPGGCVRDAVSCVYTPRVHIRDNWGWCASSVNGDGGMFDSSPHGEQTESASCDYARQSEPWIYYGGEIVVTP